MDVNRLTKRFHLGTWLVFMVLSHGVGVAQDTTTLLKRYEFGRDRSAWNAMEVRIRDSLNRERRNAEKQLLQVLLARDSTADARILACRGLRYVGTREGTQALIALLKDPRLGAEARLAMQEKDVPDIDAALREALPLVANELKIGVIDTLGRRRDVRAVPGIREILVAIRDQSVQEAGIRALGQIGGKEAIDVLSAYEAGSQRLRRVRALAQVAAASRGVTMGLGDREAALKILNDLVTSDNTPVVRVGALYELAKAEESKRDALCKLALTDTDGTLLDAARSILPLLAVEDIRALYDKTFDELTPQAQTLLVEFWEPAYKHSNKMRELSLSNEVDPLLRKAAIRAIDRS